MPKAEPAKNERDRQPPRRRALSYAVPLPKAWPRHVKSALLDVIAIAHLALVASRAWCADSPLQRVKLRARVAELETEVGLLKEELRIKDDRMTRTPAQKRPHYTPAARLDILVLRAARGWSAAQTARRLLVDAHTIAAWNRRKDEGGEGALLETNRPVNTYPELVAEIVVRLKTLCPTMGKVKLAKTLARAGLHVSASTIRRMSTRKKPPPEPGPAKGPAKADGGGAATEGSPTPPKAKANTGVIARGPNHTWVVDMTIVSTREGFWVPWIPNAILPLFPFAWWVALVIDQHSRRVMGFSVFPKNPTGAEVRSFLGRTMHAAGATPKYIISDLGAQFTTDAHEQWADRKGITLRFASKDSIRATSAVERFFRSMKSEWLRKIHIPLGRGSIRDAITTYVAWYHEHRPHLGLRGRTPAEVYEGRAPQNEAPRFEPRAKWPRTARCAAPQAEVRGDPGVGLELHVTFADEHELLPIVELKKAA